MAGETIERAAIRRYSTVWSVPPIDRHPLPVKGLSLCGFHGRRQNGTRGGGSFRAPEPRA